MARASTQLKRGPLPRERSPGQLVGRKYVKLLEGHLADLRKCHPHPNRVLFYDDVVVVYLLGFFNGSLRSLRCIEDASQMPGLRRHLSVQAVCRSTLSDANALFDPALLQGLITRLRADLPDLERHDPALQHLLEQVQVVDGSFFRLAGDVAWALHLTRPNGKPLGQVRLNCQLCLRTGVPSGVGVSGDDGTGEGAEAAAFIAPGQIYLFDSGVVSFAYLKAILDGGSQFLCALREAVHFDAEPEPSGPPTPADHAAGVLSDRAGTLPGSRHTPAPEARLREVRVAYVDRAGKPCTLRLLTSLLELPAHQVAALYRYRWQIELFFRWLKVSANFEHLTSHSRNGVTLGFHIAVIACLLTALHTQQGLSKYSQVLLGMVAAGQAELEDVLPVLANRERQRQRDRARQAARRAGKKSV